MSNGTFSVVKVFRFIVLSIAVVISVFAFMARNGKSQSGSVSNAICTPNNIPKNSGFACNACLTKIYYSTTCAGNACWSIMCLGSTMYLSQTCAYNKGTNCNQTGTSAAYVCNSGGSNQSCYKWGGGTSNCVSSTGSCSSPPCTNGTGMKSGSSSSYYATCTP